MSKPKSAGKSALVGINLTEYESCAPFDGDYPATLAALRDRLARLQLAQSAYGRRTLLLFEGFSGAGKKDALRTLSGALDPCLFTVHCEGRGNNDGRHWLAPYWSALPRRCETAIFIPAWYSAAVARRAQGGLGDKPWARISDEINEFEAQQTDDGTLIVKLFFHAPAEVQEQRLKDRDSDPWLRAAYEKAEPQPERQALLDAWQDMFKRTDTRWARWTVVAAGDPQCARVTALTTIASALDKALPAEPPATSDNVVSFTHDRRG